MNIDLPNFNLLIKQSLVNKKLTKRKEGDLETYNQIMVIDGLKLQIINKTTFLLKHGAMGPYQRKFNNCHLESKLALTMQQLREGIQIDVYEDDEY